MLSYEYQPEVVKLVASKGDDSMNILGKRDLWAIAISLLLCTMLVITSCSSPSLPKGAVGNAGQITIRPP